MATYQKSPSSKSPAGSAPAAASYGSYKDRNLAAANPLAAQEELKPTEAEPVNMHKRMAGCS